MDRKRARDVIAPLYVVARAVLLDALDALGEQRNAVVLVGAQAIYLDANGGSRHAAARKPGGDGAIVRPASK